MIQKIIFTLLLFGISYSYSNTPSVLFENANALYKRAEYQKAASTYEEILKTGVASSELYFNLGNAYYKLNQIPFAILYYERALLLAPSDEDIQTNLEMAKLKTVDKIEQLPQLAIFTWIESLTNFMSSNLWALTSIILFGLTLLFISIFLYSKVLHIRKMSFWLSVFVLIGFITSIYFSQKQKIKIESHGFAILVSPSITVKSSPNENGTDLFVIHEGTKVSILSKSDTWVEIKLSDGKVGWLQEKDMIII